MRQALMMLTIALLSVNASAFLRDQTQNPNSYEWFKINLGDYFPLCLFAPPKFATTVQPQIASDFVPETYFDGIWHDQARTDWIFNYKDTCCVAKYVTTKDKTGALSVSVKNICSSGEGITATGVSIGEPGKFYIVFDLPFYVPFARGNYWVLWQNEKKNVTLVGEPCRTLGWVLTREEHPAAEDVQAALDVAKKFGYNTAENKIVRRRATCDPSKDIPGL